MEPVRVDGSGWSGCRWTTPRTGPRTVVPGTRAAIRAAERPGHRWTGACGWTRGRVIAGHRVAARWEAATADGGTRQGAQHQVGGIVADVHQREPIVDGDGADDRGGDAGLVGDGPDQVAGPEP